MELAGSASHISTVTGTTTWGRWARTYRASWRSSSATPVTPPSPPSGTGTTRTSRYVATQTLGKSYQTSWRKREGCLKHSSRKTFHFKLSTSKPTTFGGFKIAKKRKLEGNEISFLSAPVCWEEIVSDHC